VPNYIKGIPQRILFICPNILAELSITVQNLCHKI
jgi:hypothetical protein